MTAHHDRLRAMLLVHRLEAACRSDSGEDADTVSSLTARVTRIYARLEEVRSAVTGNPLGDEADTGVEAEAWMLAVYDAALVELCAAVGLRHSLVEDAVSSQDERQRVELELLSSVLPFG